MPLIVCIETAAPAIMVAIGNEDGVLYEEAPTGKVEGPVFLHGAVRRGLGSIGAKPGDIDAVAVDLGPGGLTATRGGVTFANALSWGLGKPVLPLDYFDLVAHETGVSSTVVCVRPTTAGKGFVASRTRARRGPLMIGDLERLAEHYLDWQEDLVVAGVVTAQIAALFPGVPVGARFASAQTLVCLSLDAIAQGRHSFQPLEPLTTGSAAVITSAEGDGDGADRRVRCQ